MKISIILSIAVALFFVSCRKEDNPVLPALSRVPFPLITLDPASDASISAQNADAFHGKFNVDVYFKSDVPPQKMNVVIIKNGDPSTIQSIQEGLTTFPTTVEITGAQ